MSVHWVRTNSFLYPSVHPCIRWNNFVDTFEMSPCKRITSGRQHEIFWQTSSVHIIPESSSSSISEDSFVRNGDFLDCVQVIILFELFTSVLGKVAINVGEYVFNNGVCI